MLTLLPATRHYLKNPAGPDECWPSADKGRRDRVEVVTMYRCTVCETKHYSRDEAEDCCAPSGLHDQEGFVNCPICGAGHPDHRHAVDCCLWKDIDAPTRWKIADAVELGATWEEAIGVHAC